MRHNRTMSNVRAYHPSSTLAPWAEVVPGVGPTRVEDLLTIADDGWRYEVVEGVLIRVAGSAFDATTIAGIILAALLGYVRSRRLGAVTGADGVYKFPNAETGLLPDVGFVSAAKIPFIDKKKPIPFAPDLAIEVASPAQSHDDMADKALRYLDGGTRLVWIVWPDARQVDVWRPGDRRPSSTLRADDSLDGEDVVPGFRHPIADIFADY